MPTATDNRVDALIKKLIDDTKVKQPLSGSAVPGTMNSFDLLYLSNDMRKSMTAVEQQVRVLQAGGNLTDTDKMFAMQIALNTWSVIVNLLTNYIKVVADSLKAIVRNVA